MNTKHQNAMKAYQTPEMEFVDILVESCFALSGTGIDDLTEEELGW